MSFFSKTLIITTLLHRTGWGLMSKGAIMVHTRVYESVIILNATLEDVQIDAEVEKIKDFIQKNAGEIRAVEKWGRRRLAYAIKKKNNGFYVLYEFKAPGDLIAKLERQYHLNENVIRFLTIELDKKALKAKEEGQRTPITEPVVAVEEKGAPQ